uniref:Polymerase/histidinol phosphatase N-terminal domain-containing protein n=1 Tax=Setaria italica TaxID=4555 RepID=K4ACK9_SETIT
MGSKKKSKPCRSKKKAKTSADQAQALDYVRAWAHLAPPEPSAADADTDDFLPAQAARGGGGGDVLFELHSHSNHSDGFLSPTALVERAHRNGVKALALTDHDTMAGIPEAVSAASKFGIRIIPGVEISALYNPREVAGAGEPVHILAYYGTCGPSRYDELYSMLLNIRDGRYLRAKNMLAKLNRLKVPIKWEHITKIAGFSELAEKYGLLKLGGSDFHGRGGKDESDIGTVKLAITTLCCFLKMARPIWSTAMKDILLKFAEEPSSANLGNIIKFGQLTNADAFSPINTGIDVVDFCLSSWSSNDDMEDVELEEVRLKLAHYAAER